MILELEFRRDILLPRVGGKEDVERFAFISTRVCIRPSPHLHSGVLWRLLRGRGSLAAHSLVDSTFSVVFYHRIRSAGHRLESGDSRITRSTA